jgi:hypothetical protein
MPMRVVCEAMHDGRPLGSEGPGTSMPAAWPSALHDLEWLVAHRGPGYLIPSACGIRIGT